MASATASDPPVPLNFIWVATGLAILLTSTRIIQAGPAHIFALLAAYLVISNWQTRETQTTVGFNQEMDYRLDILGAPSNFYMDSDLINLFFSIYGWRALNANSFDLAIKAVNNVLQVESDSAKPLVRCFDNYDVAYEQARLALNLVHGFIYGISNPVLVTKLKNVLRRLQQLLERHLQKIQHNCTQIEDAKTSPDVNTRYLADAPGPKAYDPSASAHFDVY